jgi:hypothetical protein
MSFTFRCPRTKHLMNQEMCTRRKCDKVHGCTTCTVPAQVAKDLEVIEKMRVGYDFQAKGRDKRKRFYFEVDGKGLRLSRRVAVELHKRLGNILDRFKE